VSTYELEDQQHQWKEQESVLSLILNKNSSFNGKKMVFFKYDVPECLQVAFTFVTLNMILLQMGLLALGAFAKYAVPPLTFNRVV
jgi:hypothetical protein